MGCSTRYWLAQVGSRTARPQRAVLDRVKRGQAFAVVVVALLAGGLAGYTLGSSEDAPLGERQPLRACPASAWSRGGGTDYAVAGISCHEANRFIRTGRRFQPGSQEGRALLFKDWVCYQRGTGPHHGTTVNICANGKSRLRFLMH